MKRGLLSETADEDDIGIEHIGTQSIFQEGIFDGIEDAAAEMASVIDDDVLHADGPALDGDFDGLSDDCGPSPVLAESASAEQNGDFD